MGRREPGAKPLRLSTIIMVGFAVVFGIIAVFAGQAWLDRQASLRLSQMQANVKPVTTKTIVVAAGPLRFGAELSAKQLREIPWPDAALPNGSFASIAELLGHEGRRVVLSGIEENEPVLRGKVTGPGQRATLSGVIQDGMKAVTIRVNDVMGVAGFVLPGDRVDVVMTRQLEQGAYSDIVLQNVRVLGIDQSADERADKPAVVKAVTVEVTTEDAQKVALASSVGALSLALRRIGENGQSPARRVTVSDLGQNGPGIDTTVTRALPDPAPAPRLNLTTTVGVMRAVKREEYRVPAEVGE